MDRSIGAIWLILAPVIMLALAQVLLKWQSNMATEMHTGLVDYLKVLVLAPWFWVAILLAGAALVLWLLVLGRLPLSFAYPFISLTFPLVAILSVAVLNEHLRAGQILGLSLIVAGVVLNARYGS